MGKIKLIFYVVLAFVIYKGYVAFTNFEIGNLLSTKVLSLNDWGIIIAVAVLVVVIEEFRKFIVNSGIFAIGGSR